MNRTGRTYCTVIRVLSNYSPIIIFDWHMHQENDTEIKTGYGKIYDFTL